MSAVLFSSFKFSRGDVKANAQLLFCRSPVLSTGTGVSSFVVTCVWGEGCLTEMCVASQLPNVPPVCSTQCVPFIFRKTDRSLV